MMALLFKLVGPLVAWVLPKWAKARAASAGVGQDLIPFVGAALLVLAAGVAAVTALQRGAQSRLARAECVTAVATATAQDLAAEMARRQDAEAAANGERQAREAEQAAALAKVAGLEQALAGLKTRGTCYPPEIVKRLNQ